MPNHALDSPPENKGSIHAYAASIASRRYGGMSKYEGHTASGKTPVRITREEGKLKIRIGTQTLKSFTIPIEQIEAAVKEWSEERLNTGVLVNHYCAKYRP